MRREKVGLHVHDRADGCERRLGASVAAFGGFRNLEELRAPPAVQCAQADRRAASGLRGECIGEPLILGDESDAVAHLPAEPTTARMASGRPPLVGAELPQERGKGVLESSHAHQILSE